MSHPLHCCLHIAPRGCPVFLHRFDLCLLHASLILCDALSVWEESGFEVSVSASPRVVKLSIVLHSHLVTINSKRSSPLPLAILDSVSGGMFDECEMGCNDSMCVCGVRHTFEWSKSCYLCHCVMFASVTSSVMHVYDVM